MANKGRPKKVRFIQKMPKIVQFSPRGKPGRPDEVELTLDEYEAIKLADYQDFDQVKGALAMKLSRASFGRILRGSRKKIADALVNGKTIKIRMGDVQVGVRKAEYTPENIKNELDKFSERSKKMVEEMQKISSSAKLKSRKRQVPQKDRIL